MKKNILYVVIVILAIAITAGVTYLIVDNNNNNDSKEGEENNNAKETITLSESELEKYLSYVPNDTSDSGFSAYATPINVNDIDNKELLGITLDYAFSLCIDGHCERNNNLGLVCDYQSMLNVVIPKATIDDLMIKRYNLEYTVEDNLSEWVTSYGFNCFYYSNNYFIADTCSGSFSPLNLSIIESYDATENELVIYEYAVTNYSTEVWDTNGDDIEKKYNIIEDYYTDYSINVYDICKYDADCANNYFKEHKTNFTKYKHTFKKNDTGYYWYSTEIER